MAKQMQMLFSTPQHAKLLSAGATPELLALIEKALANLPAVKAGTFDWESLIADVTKIITDSPQVVGDLVAIFGIIGTVPLDLAALFAAIVKTFGDAPRVITDVQALIALIFPPAPAPTP